MNIAQRIGLLGFTQIVEVRNRIEAMRAAGHHVLRLEGGEPFMRTPDFITEAMDAAIHEGHTRYAPPVGVPDLLQALHEKVVRTNGIPASPEDVIVVPGGGHGLFCAFLATVDPGDEVLCLVPYWTPVQDLISFAGGKVVTVPWSDVHAGSMEEALEARVTPRTRAFYVNTPANPTGDVLSREQLQAIARFAEKHDITVIADEAYEDVIYDAEHVSIASFAGMFERTITVYTLSKTYAMTGWRIGYVVAPFSIMDALCKLVLSSITCVSTPTQYAALAAIRHGAEFCMETRAAYRARRDLLVGALRKAGFECTVPDGTFYTFADVSKRLGNDSWRAMEALLERASISSVPGVVFGQEGEGHLRMSFSIDQATLEGAVAALERL